jgi:hypothetical protein
MERSLLVAFRALRLPPLATNWYPLVQSLV